MTWLNDGSKRLFVVKRKNAEIYYTGGYKTGEQPQLYKIGHAKVARNKLNKMLDLETPTKTYEEWLGERLENAFTRRYYEAYIANRSHGPWIVGEVQLCASEVSDA
jgi:hypothetical protein